MKRAPGQVVGFFLLVTSGVTGCSGGDPRAGLPEGAGRDASGTAPFAPETRSLPSYRALRPGADLDRAAALAAALGLTREGFARGAALAPDGAIRYLDRARFQRVPTRKAAPPAPGFRDERGLATARGDDAIDLDALAAARVLPGPDAVARARDALDAARLPVGREVAVGHSLFEVSDLEGREVARAELDTQVNFRETLEGLRLIGPGAKVKVTFDPEGVVTHLLYAFRELERGEDVAIVPPSEAAALCAAALGEGAAPAAEPELVYYAPPLSSDARWILPHYVCSARRRSGEEEVDVRKVIVPAALGAPAAAVSALSTRLRGAAARSEEPRPTAPAPGQGAQGTVGAEWVGRCGGLSHSKANVDGMLARFQASGIGPRFNWGDHRAWEVDFKDPALGGQDVSFADSVDLTFYTGHANGSGFMFCTNMSDGFLHFTDARWGNAELEWMVVAACGPLQDDAGAWRYRWAGAFDGLHLLLGYATESFDDTTEGAAFAGRLLDEASPAPLRQAWATTAIEVQPDDQVIYAVMGVYGPDWTLPNYEDHFWGMGPVGPDLRGAEKLGFWRISGKT
ncbi:hypothetical protein SOCE26_051990 [Sorangium cellulosum]|uniref:Uncharacterized protein n=1 Tax=Sorangium cellulosum TaxID=56 RepID=A0A2L0EWR3_SORCE|nr:DUF6345 domain-containing protein [Sorangium cellulosum]AUX43744.1 hypothetical protein SOCE26_051990 [Sorangium cellulosum]